jgi:undecaprenyl-diphosphatase
MLHAAWPAAVQAFDEAVLRASVGEPRPAVPIFHAATVVGAGWGLFALLPLAWSKATRKATLWLFAAIVLTSGAVSLIKALVGRPRPCDALAWCSPVDIASPGGASFPSGHAAGSFAFAAFVAVRWPRFGPAAVVYAAIVAWSRCALGVHYPTDVLTGSLLGAAIGLAFARVSKRA